MQPTGVNLSKVYNYIFYTLLRSEKDFEESPKTKIKSPIPIFRRSIYLYQRGSKRGERSTDSLLEKMKRCRVKEEDILP